MKQNKTLSILLLTAFSSLVFSFTTFQPANFKPKDPLPSWNEGNSKKAIIDFVKKTTTKGNADFVAIADRIACFDNDGTLWSEQPMYFQLAFALDRIKAMAPDHPEWKTTQPFQSVLEGNIKAALAGGEKALVQIVMATHSGMSEEAFAKTVKDWLATSTHPVKKKHYNELIYQPMLELLNYLRANGYKTYIVSGGGVDFMRPWVEKAYGIPPEQVIGSSGKLKYDTATGNIFKLPEIDFIDDKEGKPLAIQKHIGKRPVFTAGNSDGDYAMLQYTSTGTGPRFGLIVHHTDAEREWSYDRASHIGKLDKGLNDASKYNWQIVDMKKEWKKVYPFE